MRISAFMYGTTLLLAGASATMAAAQERGTVEAGLYGAAGFYDKPVTKLNTSFGGGGRFAAFLDPRLAVEFDVSQLHATRTGNLGDVDLRSVAARLNWTFMQAGPLSLIIGGGGGAMYGAEPVRSYTVGGLVGAKFMMTDNVALRADLLGNWLKGKNWAPTQVLQVGLSIFRHPNAVVQVVQVAAPSAPAMPTMRARVDTVYRNRVDTVPRFRVDSVKVMEPAPDQLVLRVQFATGKATLLPRSRPVLDTIAQAIIATPNSTWEVSGHTDGVGTPAANKALSLERAQSVVDYLASKGVDRSTLTAEGYGETRPVFSNASDYGRAQNRRVQLRRIPPPPTGPRIK